MNDNNNNGDEPGQDPGSASSNGPDYERLVAAYRSRPFLSRHDLEFYIADYENRYHLTRSEAVTRLADNIQAMIIR